MDATHDLPDEVATARLGAALAGALRPGDTVLLDGPLAVGKSALCRAILRALTGDAALEVPSPTYTLTQAYATRLGPVHHYDLWRLGGADGLEEIGFFDAGGIRLVEWAERLAAWGVAVPEARVWEISLTMAGAGRRACVRGPAWP